jgi:hypothetical protein
VGREKETETERVTEKWAETAADVPYDPTKKKQGNPRKDRKKEGPSETKDPIRPSRNKDNRRD